MDFKETCSHCERGGLARISRCVRTRTVEYKTQILLRLGINPLVTPGAVLWDVYRLYKSSMEQIIGIPYNRSKTEPGLDSEDKFQNVEGRWRW